jgi:hypothetical protein
MRRFNVFQTNAIREGLWYAEGDEDKYDWQGARARVEKILNEYGASLPKTDEA